MNRPKMPIALGITSKKNVAQEENATVTVILN